MAVYKQPGSKNWWYKFVWNGKHIRASTKQQNKRLAEQMEAAHKARLAKGEVGIRERVAIPTLAEFAETEFLPFVEARSAEKPKTLEYYRNGVKNLVAFDPIGGASLDAITTDRIAAFIKRRRSRGLEVSSINRELEVLRRMFRLAAEWRRVDRPLPKVEMLSGEKHRDRVLSGTEESQYILAAQTLGEMIDASYFRALNGIRAKRGQEPIKPDDPYLLSDLAVLLLDCGLRPDEAFRLNFQEVRDEALHVLYGKTRSARRSIPLSERVADMLEARRIRLSEGWVFPAPTKSGHIEKSSLKKQHRRVCRMAKIAHFTLYTFRHTCLTRWSAHMDPSALSRNDPPLLARNDLGILT